jgi:hypothetical protein
MLRAELAPARSLDALSRSSPAPSAAPIAAVVAAGFEHSVANMYFVPAALLLTHFDPAFVAAHSVRDAERSSTDG